MPPQLRRRRAYRLETEWIRGYARTYLPSEAGFSFSAEDLRSSGMSLVAVRYVLSRGVVTFAEKLDEPGAIWVVEGKDNEENEYRLTLKVISEEQAVTLITVTKNEAEPSRGLGKKDNGYDAA